MKRAHTVLAAILMFGAAPIALVACGGGLAGLCNDICNCEGCSDKELEECEENAGKTTEEAAEEGCEDELDELIACKESAFKCSGDKAKFTDDCDDAVEDLRKCGVTGGVAIGNVCDIAVEICGAVAEDNFECNGASECASQCIVDANTCDFADSNLARCVTNCQGPIEGEDF